MSRLYSLLLVFIIISCKNEEVKEIKSDQKALLSFSFTKSANPSLPADVEGIISGKQITFILPSGTNAGALKASFSNSPLSTVSKGGTQQESGVTSNDFTQPVTYRVTAEDGSTADYTVTVTVATPTGSQLLSLQFLASSNPSLSGDVNIALTPGKTSYLLTLPTGAHQTAFKATFSLSPGATLSVGGAVQTSGSSALDYSRVLTYRVTAANGTYTDYTMESSIQLNLANVDNAVQAFMTKWSVPGMSVAIALDERLIYAKGYGFAVKETNTPVTPLTQFRVASVSKTFTAAAILKLVDDGKLTLDQKVFGTGGILGTTYGTQPYAANIDKITVRQLLDHTAGGDAWTSAWDLANNRIDPFYQKEWIGYTQAQVISATLNTRPPTQVPGTKFVYSNVDVNIAGRVIEKVTGVKYETYVQETLLKPIGISPTVTRIGGTTKADRFPNEVVYYHPYTGYDQPYDFPVSRFDAHGGWVTTAADLIRLLVHIDGYAGKKDILSTKSITEMLTPTPVSVTQLGGNLGYGLGCYVNPANTISTHRGGMAGLAAVWWRLNSVSKYTWVLLMNNQPNDAAFLNELDVLMNNYLNNPAGSMKGDQFDLFYK